MTKPSDPITEEEAKIYTFVEWITERLQTVDPNVIVEQDSLGRVSVRLADTWHIMTIYAPPIGPLGAWLDEYPRQKQTEMFRQAIFGINAWCRFATDETTGEAILPS